MTSTSRDGSIPDTSPFGGPKKKKNSRESVTDYFKSPLYWQFYQGLVSNSKGLKNLPKANYKYMYY